MNEPREISGWVAAAQSGETIAWNFLYQHSYPRLYSLALTISGSIPEAKDLVQETFITAWLKIAQLKKTEAFEGWLKKILLRNYFHVWKKRRTNKTIPGGESSSSWVDDELQKLDDLSNEKRLYHALTLLPVNLRVTMMLRYFSRYNSYDQIAKILSVPVGTIRSRLNEGKQKLSEKWNEHQHSGSTHEREKDEWNGFYKESWSGLHRHVECKQKFVDHLDKRIQMNMPGDQLFIGPGIFEDLIASDLKAGSWLSPSSIMTCGNISVIEARHFNSPEFPDHCPATSVCIIGRENSRANKMRIYLNWE